MAEATSIQGPLPGRAAEPAAPSRAPRPAEPQASPSVQRADDQVELSEMAMFLSKLRDLPEIRADLVARVRGEIAAGLYDTPEKLSSALDGMIDDAELLP